MDASGTIAAWSTVASSSSNSDALGNGAANCRNALDVNALGTGTANYHNLLNVDVLSTGAANRRGIFNAEPLGTGAASRHKVSDADMGVLALGTGTDNWCEFECGCIIYWLRMIGTRLNEDVLGTGASFNAKSDASGTRTTLNRECLWHCCKFDFVGDTFGWDEVLLLLLLLAIIHDIKSNKK